ncbi:MAG TPA: prenyltransferase/squalene oxidase repeat-containing protein [Gemmataceae bacterium]|nr:prenyltransferase/squalene oxidase repeat-containing protein [Gemmataceae bacterium]
MARALRWAAVGVALLLVPATRAADPQKVKQAIDKGVAYLKGLQQGDGTWSYTEDVVGSRDRGGPTVGATALAGLTLLECGVPADDPAVQKAAGVVRGAALPMTMTYALSLSVLFLDRLDDPADEVLIDSMALRLLAGQNPSSGGWSYDCPPLTEAEVGRLQAALKQRPGGARAPKGQRTVKDLPAVIQAQWRQLNRPGAGAGFATLGTDNSNTHLAILALWVARRQGVPVETALKRVEHRFRTSQITDGGWSYRPPQEARGFAGFQSRSTPSMTCAALIGLALSHGGTLEATLHTGRERTTAAPDPGKDPYIKRGLTFLAREVGAEQGWLPGSRLPTPPGGFGQPPGLRPAAPQAVGGNGNLFYGLWTLERMAVAFDLKTVGKKDWYDWGANLLLRKQEQSGSWRGDYVAGGCDTCFALLFLSRANFAKDLTAVLKGRVMDPGERELRAGNVGPENRPPAPAVRPQPRPRPADTDRVDAEAARLAGELVGAEGIQQAKLLGRLRDSKGGVYTEALAQAIPRLSGEAKGKARDALADRLTRMTAGTLADKLADDDPEVRRAAALASAMKEERSHVPRLIQLLDDKEPAVAHAAHAALKSLTGQDLGPKPGASKADVAQAMLQWSKWWNQHGDK